MKTNHKKLILILSLLVIICAAGFGAYLYLGQADASQTSSIYTVKQMDITQTINADGRIKTADDIPLSFMRSGQIVRSLPAVGQSVKAGQILASLDTSDLEIQLKTAQNALLAAELKLNQLKNAQNPEISHLTEIRAAIEAARENNINKLKEAYITADGILGSSINQFYDEPESNNPMFGMIINVPLSTSLAQGVAVYQIKAPVEESFKLNAQRRAISDSMKKWNTDLQLGAQNLENAQNDAETTLRQIQDLLTEIAGVMNNFNSDNNSVNQIYSNYKSILQSARSTINATLSGVLAAKQAYNSSIANVNPDDIKNAQIAFDNAQNQIESIKNQIAKSSIYAPIDGIISKNDAKIGQTASAGAPLIEIISNSYLQIETLLAQSDVVKVKVGQPAMVIVDALPQEVFEAKVVSIDPSPQSNNGAPSYKTTLQFTVKNAEFKPGMSANVSIVVAKKNNILAVPARAIIKKDGKEFVMIADGGNGLERQIITGIADQEGNVEVVNGLKEGEKIINY